VTFPERPARWIDRNVGRITMVLAAGTIMCLVGLGYLNTRVSDQAHDGAVALARSCKLASVSKKVYIDNLRRGVITADDYALFTGTLQQACSRR
jgi:hypothetical protein